MVADRYCLLPRRVEPPPSAEPITAAEQEVLGWVCAGYSNKEIAQFLGKAEPTVKHQVSACLRKFGLSSRMRLIAALRIDNSHEGFHPDFRGTPAGDLVPSGSRALLAGRFR
jgi:DNA-binding NarL/FixJ family response regulator